MNALADSNDDWASYTELKRHKNHWNRPGWLPGRRSYHWLLTFDDEPSVVDLAARCRAELGDISHFDLVPKAGLHLTLFRMAFTDEIDVGEVHARLDDVRRTVRIEPFLARIGSLSGSAGSLRLSATPHAQFHELRRQLGGAEGPTGSTFTPHVSIAYSNADTPAGPLRERVSQLRSLGSVEVPIEVVDLVELRQAGQSWTWSVLHSVSLRR